MLASLATAVAQATSVSVTQPPPTASYLQEEISDTTDISVIRAWMTQSTSPHTWWELSAASRRHLVSSARTYPQTLSSTSLYVKMDCMKLWKLAKLSAFSWIQAANLANVLLLK
jgi:hypothetical protein